MCGIRRFPFNQNVRFEFWAISGSEWNSIFRNSEKEDHLARYTQIFESFFLEVFFPYNFDPGISRISVEWFAFLKFISFRNIWKLFREISAPFAAVSKFSKMLVEWKAPQISSYHITIYSCHFDFYAYFVNREKARHKLTG